jgi:hypothetical protein
MRISSPDRYGRATGASHPSYSECFAPAAEVTARILRSFMGSLFELAAE